MRSLTVSLLLVVLVSIFGLGWGLDALFSRYSNDSEDDTSLMLSLGTDIASTLNNMASPQVFVDQWQSPVSATVSLSELSNFPLPDAIAAEFIAGEPLLLESEQGVSANFYLPDHGQVFSMDNIPVFDTNKWWVKAVFTSLFYLGTLLLVLLWLKPLLLRLRNLKTAADEFGAGNLQSRVSTAGISYIADIEKKYNHMAEQIQLLVEDNKLLTSAVSHDLRTPLARLRFGIDTLSATEDSQVRSKYQKRVSHDLDEMESLVDSLLRYARLDNVMNDVEKEYFPLHELIQECASQYLDETVHVTVRCSQPGSSTVFGSYEHLATMVNNLLQNAVVHAKTQVMVDLSFSDGHPLLSVSDDGPGIESKDRDKLLKPFQRGADAARSGYGLGLAIVSRIAAHHNAVLDISHSSALGGAELTVQFGIEQGASDKKS